jgi:small subunit ribosomal protein S7
MMIDGKKSLAEHIVHQSLNESARQLATILNTEVSPLSVIEKAIENIKTGFIIIRRKVGANSVQIPHPVEDYKQLSVAIINLKNAIRELQEKSKRSIVECMTEILVNTYQNKGVAVKKKEEVEQIAVKNRVFVHYSWMRKKIKKKNAKKKKKEGVGFSSNLLSMRNENIDMDNNVEEQLAKVKANIVQDGIDSTIAAAA